MPSVSRRALLLQGVGFAAASAIPCQRLLATEPPNSVVNISDFDELWRTLAERYCFFGEKRTDWNAVRAMYRPQAEAAQSREALVDVVMRTLRELYDPHSFLHEPPADSPRSPYFDMWIEPDRNGAALITSVRRGMAAEDVGIRPGETVTGVNGQRIEGLAAALMPKCLSRPDPAALAYALNIAVGSRRGKPRRLRVRSPGGREREVVVPLKAWPSGPNIESRRLPGGFGCITIRSFADQAVLDAFDAALLEFRDAPGLVIDVRENGGGDTAIARPIMGRFITERRPYARMRRRDGAGLSEAWTEHVEPRGPFPYRAPVVVLTTRWSASMAEGFPMGMRGLGRATIVGTPMMQVGAAVFMLRLDLSGIALQYSAEPVYDVQDRPRWELRPDVETAPGADIMAAGIATLQRMVAGTRGRA